MALIPRTPATTVTGVDNYRSPAKLSLDNIARPGGALPPQMSGENIEETPILPADSARVNDTYKEETRGSQDQQYGEPGMPYSGSVNSQIWHTRHGGAYIEVSGKRGIPEFINIVHTSGTHITLDQNGSLIIKSFGDTHNVTKGNMYETTSGEKVQVHSGGYTIHVKNGTVDIRSEGNLNISSGADMNISAAGKMTMNVGDALDLAGSKIAFTSRVDSLDIVSNGDIRFQSLGNLNLKGENTFLEGVSELNIKSGADGYFEAGGALNLLGGDDARLSGSNAHVKGSTVFIDNIVQMANGGAKAASAASAATEGIRAGVAAELQKSVFSDNTIAPSARSAGAAATADDPGE